MNFDQIPSAETLLTGTGIAAGNEAFHASADSHKAADASQETLERSNRFPKNSTRPV
jgi:hypothetical protein